MALETLPEVENRSEQTEMKERREYLLRRFTGRDDVITGIVIGAASYAGILDDLDGYFYEIDDFVIKGLKDGVHYQRYFEMAELNEEQLTLDIMEDIQLAARRAARVVGLLAVDWDARPLNREEFLRKRYRALAKE